MQFGLKNRMMKTFSPKDNRTLMLAVDHGYFQGPTTGLRNLKAALDPLLPHTDCLYITKGMLKNSVQPEIQTPIFLRVSGGPSILGELSNEEIVTSVEAAVKLNAVGVGMSIFVGAKNEDRSIANLGMLVDEAESFGMPVLAITAVGRDMARDERYLGLACRIAAEHGAHIVKTYYCKDFEKIVEACPVPIVIAGGKKIAEKDALQMARDALDAGAAGVDMGRNIFQSDSPVGMIKAVKDIIHKNATVKEAFAIYEKEKK